MRRKPDIAAEVAALADLSREDLIERWHKIYGVRPSKGARHDLLVRAVVWHHQAKRLGGLSGQTRSLLKSAVQKVEASMLSRGKRHAIGSEKQKRMQIDDEVPADQIPSEVKAQQLSPRRRLSPGARLMREWNGKTHIVDVIEGGFVFEAKVYRSLTSIALRITGAHWSGPRFFGI